MRPAEQAAAVAGKERVAEVTSAYLQGQRGAQAAARYLPNFEDDIPAERGAPFAIRGELDIRIWAMASLENAWLAQRLGPQVMPLEAAHVLRAGTGQIGVQQSRE